MSTSKPPNWGAASIGQRIDEAVELIEMELRHAIAYVNDAVVPQVRRESIVAMRSAAETLRNLADRFEQTHNAASPGSSRMHAPSQNPSGEPRR
jgi:hypothetical protein